jgi:hypothetical protein
MEHREDEAYKGNFSLYIGFLFFFFLGLVVGLGLNPEVGIGGQKKSSAGAIQGRGHR